MIIPTGYAQANLIFTGADAPNGAQVTMGFDIGGYGGDPQSLAEDLRDSISGGGLEDVFTASWTISGILVKFGPNLTGPSHLLSTNLVGNQVTATAPPNVTTLWLKNTALGGRAGRGRSYIPGVPENAVNGAGVLDSSFTSAHEGKYNDVLVAMAIQGADAVVLHAEGSPISTPTPITTVTLSGTVATQRRRLRS